MIVVNDKKSLQESLDELSRWDQIGFDTETTGLLPTHDKITSLQFGNLDQQFVVDTRKVHTKDYEHIIKEKPLIIHNALFDLSFLYAEGVYTMGNVYDTFLAESNIYLGLRMPLSLDAVVKRHLGVEISKEARKEIHRLDIFAHDHLLDYAATDVKYLTEIKRKQMKLSKSFEKAIELDNLFVSALAYIKYCGFKLDIESWMEKIQQDEQNIEKTRQELDKYVIAHYPEYANNQLNIFSTVVSSIINWNSPQQIIPVFKKAGIDVSIIDKYSGEEKESVNEKSLERQSSPLLSLYFNYKKAQTSLSKYGYNFLDACGEDGRIRTNFKQILKTGRMSSGSGKNNPNFQNIKKNGPERKCFVPEPGNVFVVCDFSQQEQVILANQSKDPGLLEFFISGGGDMHSFVTKKMYPDLRDLTFKEVKDLHPEKRDAAKKAGFAINYGGNGRTIADNLGISENEGIEIYNAYFKAFPSIDNYFKAKRKEVLDNGYVLISPITGRRSLMEDFDNWKKQYSAIDWDHYRAEKSFDSDEYYQMKGNVSRLSKIKSAMQKKSLNYPVQGTGAEMMKYAGAKMFSWIIKNGYFDTVKMVNVIHDEYVLECPDHMSGVTSKVVKDSMEGASKLFCPIYYVRAEPVIGKAWTH